MSFMRQLTRTQWIGFGLVISILFVDMLLYSLFIPVVPYFTERHEMSSTMVGILFGSYAAALFLLTPFFGRITDRIGRRQTIILGLASMVGATMLEPLLPLYLTERFQMDPLALGLLFGLMTLCYGFIAPVAGAMSARFNPFRLMVIGVAAMAVVLPFIAVAGHPVLVLAAGCLIGAAVGFTLSPTLPTLGAIVDTGGEGDYGVAYALFNMIHAVGMMLGPLVGGVLTDILPIASALAAVALVLLATAIGGGLFVRRHPRLFSLSETAQGTTS